MVGFLFGLWRRCSGSRAVMSVGPSGHRVWMLVGLLKDVSGFGFMGGQGGGLLGAIWELPESLLGASWGFLGALGGLLGPFWSLMVASWGLLEPFRSRGLEMSVRAPLSGRALS
eukprot:8601168-Pyramimonas_sp.AAC.1